MPELTFGVRREYEGTLRSSSCAICHGPVKYEEKWDDDSGLVRSCSGADVLPSYTLRVGQTYTYYGNESGYPYRYDWFNIYRGGLLFDTSELPDDAVITAVILRLTWYETRDLEDVRHLHVVKGAGIHSPLYGGLCAGSPGDYFYLLSKTTSFGQISCTHQVDDESFDIELNAFGLAEIVKDGLTRLGLRISSDILGASPAKSGRSYSEYCNVWTRVGGHGGEAPKLIVTYTGAVVEAEPGHIWASDESGEETELHCIDADSVERQIEGASVSSGNEPGHLFVEGTYIHYTDSEGAERRREGELTGNTGESGHIFVEGENLHYIDSAGNERYCGGVWILGVSKLGIDTVL